MEKLRRILLAVTVSLAAFFILHTGRVSADSSCPLSDPCQNAGSVFDKVTCYSGVVENCSNQRESMAAQIVYLSTKIELSNAKIAAIQQKMSDINNEISQLNVKISQLENSLTTITGLLINRIVATYKYREVSMLDLLLTSSQFSDFFNRYKYIQTTQNHNRRLLFQIQNSKVNFEDQKQLREQKKKELAILQNQLLQEQNTLAAQKIEKELFLETTKNNESRYRDELIQAQKEAQAIQQAASLLSSAGVARHVGKGEVIGLMGNTGYSTGAHLHFAVYNLRESDLGKFNFNTDYENPFNDLKPATLPFDPNSCDDVTGSGRINKLIGSGSWDWPMENPFVSQCFGHTPWAWRYQLGIHNGVDMYNDNNIFIHAVDEGNAYVYRGGQTNGNGVFIFHSNGKMTLYWHLQ